MTALVFMVSHHDGSGCSLKVDVGDLERGINDQTRGKLRFEPSLLKSLLPCASAVASATV
jgi:hypothetical protein